MRRPVMLVLVFALLPRRTRTFAVLVPVAAGIAAAAPAVLRVGDNLQNGEVAGSTMHTAVIAAFAAAVAVGLVVALAAAIESRSPALRARQAAAAPGRRRDRDRSRSWRCSAVGWARGRQPGDAGQTRLGHLQVRLRREQFGGAAG